MLPNRAFCAFPILEELALDSCHLLNIYGSPFQCLKRLKSLSLFGNNIEVLYGNSVNGLQNLVTLNISNNNIEYFQGSHILLTLVSLRSLSLSNNLLTELNLRPQGEIMIEELNIERNNVKLWEPPLFSFMFKLKKLGLAHNNITKLDNKMLHDIRHVRDVEFGWNQWDCSSCDLNNIHSLLHEHPPNCSKCFSCATPPELFGNDVRNVTLRDDDCSLEWYRVYVVPTLLCFMVATILASIAYRKRWYIMYAFLYLRVTINGYRRQRNSDDFLFDGFLSYHTSDGDWVRDVLLPKLESPPMQFRLCVAERDFIPGMQITENICRAIAHSRKSLFVISREFCRSRWCMFELSLAQHRLFESDLQDGLVFIKMNDVGESEMSSLLQYLTKSRTYVQIPEDGSSETLQNLFWLQLHAALKK
nr:toll-like receptor 2 [Rhipicephalus microplus]